MKRNWLKTVVSLSLLLAVAGTLKAQDKSALYFDATKPLEERVEDLLKRMTVDEKLAMVHASGKFSTAAVPRLGIPERWMADGPNGVREEISRDSWNSANRTDDFASYFPSGICVASTWNVQLAHDLGKAIGEEARTRGKDIMLAPGVNIARTPLCGRNYEYMGEDPWLASRLVVDYVKGMQGVDVAVCIKHFAVNNQEFQRSSIDVLVDERTLHEIYLPAFRAAVQEANVWSIMGAYNKFRGEWCCHNDYLLNKILKEQWGFKGLVLSDWGGVHDTKQSVFNGLDLEMGTNRPIEQNYLADAYKKGLESGEYPMSTLDDKARRNLRVMFATKVFDNDRAPGSFNTPAHQAVARKIAAEGIVLLKNEGNILPLDASKIKTIAIIGENAIKTHSRGGVSAGVKALYEITPLPALVGRLGPNVNIEYSQGYRQPPRRRRGPADNAGVRQEEATTQQAAENRVLEQMADRAVEAAKRADLVLYVGGLSHTRGQDDEGADRASLALPSNQGALINRIVEANPKTVVVLYAGSGVDMQPWLDKTPAVLLAWYPGMEGGTALSDVLLGDVNPSGKLPVTFPKKLEDFGAHSVGEFPGANGKVEYKEGMLVGYRWFDTKNIEPLFPFGYGMSYTKFNYSNLKLTNSNDAKALVTVECEITNTGSREGAEVVQVYVKDVQSSVQRPEKELKGFAKVSLKPGEKKTVSIPLKGEAFAYYDPEKTAWVAEQGDFKIVVGGSSRDMRLTGDFKLPETIVMK